MAEETVADDSSHYEVSLTAGQAFVGFVLLLFSLAASFIFGLMIGKGQVNDRLVVKKEPAVIEAGALPKGSESRIVELGVPQSDSQESAPVEVTPIEEAPAVNEPANATTVETQAETTVEAPAVAASTDATPATPVTPAEREEKKEARPPVVKEERKPVAAVVPPRETREVAKKAPAAPQLPAYAQLLSTGEAKTAESLAAKLIDAGFTTAYVERSQGQSGMVYRVRVKFPSDTEARASADRLRSIARTEPWITRQ